jgi:hypothetical protein
MTGFLFDWESDLYNPLPCYDLRGGFAAQFRQDGYQRLDKPFVTDYG